MTASADRDQLVDLVGVSEVLHEHLSDALVENAFEELRNRERERAWTLQQMVSFWTAVILRAPPSLSHALREATGDIASGYPEVDASNQAFFQRSSQLRWEFFAEVFRSFVQSVTRAEPPHFAQHHRDVASRFERVLILDGSNLDPVARRLKILWKDAAAPIPGAVLACYDLMRGTLAELLFAPTLRKGELTLAREALERLPRGSLLLGDRLYGTPKFLSEVHDAGLYAVFRRQNWAKVEELQLLSRTVHGETTIEDWKVALGKTAAFPARLIRVKRGEKTYEFVTNVMDPKQLSAKEVADLYLDRWQVERMFQDLKTVLNLHCFYCGNTNAIAMQVYAAAIVYTAMRIAQGRVARDACVEPEQLSEGKLFPLFAAASSTVTTLEVGFLLTEHANPETNLCKPDWREACRLRVTLGDILADKSRGNRPRENKPKPDRHRYWCEMPPPPQGPRGPP